MGARLKSLNLLNPGRAAECAATVPTVFYREFTASEAVTQPSPRLFRSFETRATPTSSTGIGLRARKYTDFARPLSLPRQGGLEGSLVKPHSPELGQQGGRQREGRAAPAHAAGMRHATARLLDRQSARSGRLAPRKEPYWLKPRQEPSAGGFRRSDLPCGERWPSLASSLVAGARSMRWRPWTSSIGCLLRGCCGGFFDRCEREWKVRCGAPEEPMPILQ